MTARRLAILCEQGIAYSGSVAGLALQPGKRRTRIRLYAVPGLEDVEHRVIRVLIVTLDTGVGPFVGVCGGQH